MRTKSKIVRQRPPADFEEVKRRFIRQNRDLAKNNSSQSLRIRSLELEVSRLLADNLELRNQVLRLQSEVYTAQSQASSAAVARVKQKLLAKIAELSGIVDGIEESAGSGRDVTRERKPIEGNWRERQPLTEIMRESQMPTIVEDKQYPRRTLDADQIQSIRLSDHSSQESPDLGPPPVARFDYEDPVKNTSPLINKISPELPLEDDALPAALSANLETRRKRKDGQPRLETRRHSVLPQSPAKAEGETSAMLRTGAKRKLADRETEKPIRPPSKGDFTFSRKVPSEEAKAADKSVTAIQEKVAPAMHIEAQASPKPARKVLGDKSVNMSPRKTAISNSGKPEKDNVDKAAAPRFTAGKDTAPTRRRRVSAIPLPLPQNDVVDTVEILPPAPPAPSESTDPPPQTPAAPDLFSPTPSEPSIRTDRPEGRGDTPPPGDLSTLSTTTDGGTRPSRRARSAVSYTEPSLIAKMRRPDKKMVSAVAGLQDPRRAMSSSMEKKPALSRMVAVKNEPVEDEEDGDAWKNLPPATNVEPSSPLNRKRYDELEQPVKVERTTSPPATTISEHPSASSATISALMAGSRKRRQSSQHPLGTDIGNIEATTKKLEELDLYEFKESSSPQTDGSDRPARTTSKSHRRHSSMPKDVSVAIEECGSLGRAARTASRRRSMML